MFTKIIFSLLAIAFVHSHIISLWKSRKQIKKTHTKSYSVRITELAGLPNFFHSLTGAKLSKSTIEHNLI